MSNITAIVGPPASGKTLMMKRRFGEINQEPSVVWISGWQIKHLFVLHPIAKRLFLGVDTVDVLIIDDLDIKFVEEVLNLFSSDTILIHVYNEDPIEIPTPDVYLTISNWPCVEYLEKFPQIKIEHAKNDI